MKTTIHFAALALLSGFSLQPSALLAQGTLTPPGPPAPTMKTLDQIEARTPISSLPYTITNPGSYYLTANLTGSSGADGIDIATNNVTLDLNGFTLQGVAGSLNGINVLNPARNLAIRNGALDAWGHNGVDATNSYNSQFERLRVSNSNAGGLLAGTNCVVSACAAYHITGVGIFVRNNSSIKDCIANFNVAGLDVVANCTVIGCTASGNINAGILAYGDNCTIKDCTASTGNGMGIQANNNCSVKDCTASACGTGIFVGNNSTVTGCTAGGNTGDGIDVAGFNCQIFGNTCSGNASSGINIYYNNCQVIGNVCSANSQYGILISGSANRIDGNSVGNNTNYGINAMSINVKNSITRNSSPGPGYGGYIGNNDYAPYGSPNTSTNPWQNFQ